MKKNAITELVMIIDRSGSMGGMESDTIGGINAVLDQNRKLEGGCTVSTVLFDHETLVLHDRVPIERVKPLTERDYQVRGCTALLDAVGGSVKHIERVQRYMPEEYRADKVIFVITTDGLENASRKYRYPDVKRMIEAKQEEGWEFLFLGANIDAAKEARSLGIAEDRAETYVADTVGNAVMYESVAAATCAMRSEPGKRVTGGWRSKIRADRACRGK